MKPLVHLLNYLKSFWSVLALTVASLPVTTHFTNITFHPEKSLIPSLYVAIPSIAATFFLLLLTTYKKELKDLRFARRLAVFMVSLGFTIIFLFLIIKVTHLDIKRKNSSELSNGHMEKTFKENGIISSSIESYDESDKIKSKSSKDSITGDPLDVVNLALLTLSISAFTVGFSSLGIHTYMNDQENMAA